MSDEEDDKLFPTAPNLGQSFEANAGEEYPQPAASVSDHIPPEIKLNAERDAALEADDQRWKSIRDSIAFGQDHDLTPDGSATGRDLKSELDDARTRWQAENNALREGFESRRQSIREDGITLSGDFELEAGEAILSEPDITEAIDLPDDNRDHHDRDDPARDVFLVMEDDHDHENAD